MTVSYSARIPLTHAFSHSSILNPHSSILTPQSSVLFRSTHDDFTDHLTRFHALFRRRQFVECKRAVDERSDAAVGNGGQHVAHEAAHGLRPFFRNELRVRDAENLETVRVDRTEIDFGLEHA